jgi:hypothetical protein
MTLSRLTFLCTVLVGISLASNGLCDGSTTVPPASARDAKLRGDNLMESKRFLDALKAYEESYALYADPALLYNRGRALQFLGRYPEALALVEQFSRDAPPALRSRVPGLAELLTDLANHTTYLSLECQTPGAKILIDAREVGECPLRGPMRVTSGVSVVEVRAEGYLPFRREATLPGGGSAGMAIKLLPRDSSGLLVVKSKVAKARIFVDGQQLGQAPVELGVSPGPHGIRAEAPDADAVETRVVLRPTERREFFLNPQPRPGLASRWWFWTGAGLVAAGIVVIVVANVTESSPPTGNFSPGLVRF